MQLVILTGRERWENIRVKNLPIHLRQPGIHRETLSLNKRIAGKVCVLNNPPRRAINLTPLQCTVIALIFFKQPSISAHLTTVWTPWHVKTSTCFPSVDTARPTWAMAGIQRVHILHFWLKRGETKWSCLLIILPLRISEPNNLRLWKWADWWNTLAMKINSGL